MLGDLLCGIEHIGSTAVPGLAAKPIIDISVAANLEAAFPPIRKILLDNGYVYLLDAGNNGGHIFVLESARGMRTHHLHLIDANDIQWRNYLRFRDRLIEDADLRRSYAQMKEELAERYANNRDAYTLAKAQFVERAIDGPLRR